MAKLDDSFKKVTTNRITSDRHFYFSVVDVSSVLSSLLSEHHSIGSPIRA